MRRLLAASLILAAGLAALPAKAQVSGVRVVSSCGSMSPYPALSSTLGSPAWLTVDVNGNLCSGVSVSATVSISPFAPTPSYATPLSVSTVSSRVSLPTGTTITAYNAGNNAAYCTIGDSSVTATASMDQIAPGGFMSFLAGSNADIACITKTSTTTVNVSGGTGQPSGSGGGGGAGGSVPTGSAGSPNHNVMTIQGIDGGTVVPVSGTVTANAGTNLNTSALALETGGNLATTATNTGTIAGAVSGSAMTVAQSTAANLKGTMTLNQGGAALSTTNGLYSNLLQGNAVLSSSNGIYSNILLGNTAIGTSNPLTTKIVDGSGNVIASTSNNLNVQCANCSGTGASAVDGASFTASSSVFAPMGGIFQTTATSNPLTNATQGLAQLTAYRALMTDWYNSSGTEMGTSGSPVQVSIANTGANGTAVKVNVASGGIASGAIAANAAASGAFPAGSISDLAHGQGTMANSVPVVIASNQSAVPASQSGTWTVQPGNTANTTAWLVTGTGGTFPATQSGTWNINNISGTVSLPTNAATETGGNLASIKTDVDNLNLAQASTTSGQKGNLILGAATTSAPTYTNGQSNPLSLDTAGNLRVNVAAGSAGNAAASATGSGVPASADYAGLNVSGTLRGWTGVNPSGSIYAGQMDIASVGGTGSLTNYGTTPGSVPAVPTNTYVSNTNANGQATMANSSPVVIASNQTWGTADNTAFTANTTPQLAFGGVYQSTVTSNPLTAGNYGLAQLTHYRAVQTDWYNSSGTEMGTSGSPVQVSVANTAANGTAMLVTGTGGTFPVQLNGTPTVANGNGVVPTVGGTAVATANPMPSAITDGTNTASVKAASTSAVATDKSLVVQINPQQTPGVNVAQVNGVTVSTGTGAVGTGTARIAVGTDTATIAGSAPTTDLRVVGNAGGAFDAATGAAAPANAVQMGTLQSGATGGYLKAPITCDNHTFKHITTATDTAVVTGVASQTIYLCGVEPKFAGTATVYVEEDAGTSSSCGDSLSQIGGLYSGVAQNFPGFYNPTWGGFKTAAGHGVCLKSTGTGGVDVDVWWAQF